jgi:Spy/CpxP family protein refolding chaperone
MSSAITRFTFLTITAAALAAAQTTPTEGRPRFDPAKMLERRLEMLSTVLGLTEAQKVQAKTIFEAEHAALQVLQDQTRAANQALREAVQSNRTDTEIDTLAGTVGSLHGQRLAIQTKAAAQFYRILTPEQREKQNTLRRAGPGMGMPGMGPGGMGPGGPAGAGPARRRQ